MRRYDYVIVGGGMTADAAVRGIRAVDDEGEILLLSREPHPPYDRPPLSKGLWTGMEESRVWRDTEAEGCRIALATDVVSLDRMKRTVTDGEGSRYGYERLLLATGGRPRRLDGDCAAVNYFRTWKDYRSLRRAVEEHGRFIVIGGGFIGSEVASALTMHGCRVTMLFPEEGICRRVLPVGLSQRIDDLFRDRGVEVRSGITVVGVTGEDGNVQVTLEDGETLQAHGVVAGLGLLPNQELAADAGLETDDGIVTDDCFTTSDDRVFAAGDVARFPSSVLERSLRVEHEDHANSSGTRAGMAMAGRPRPYDYTPLFYSTLFDVEYEAVGVTDPAALNVVEDVCGEEGVVYYLDQGRVRGVLLWNVKGKVREAREILRDPGPFEAGGVKGRITLS